MVEIHHARPKFMHTVETRKRAYQKIKDRKRVWFSLNGPCKRCGSWENLELDHINRNEKESHCVWSWSEDRRSKELEKCQVLCHNCHAKKTHEDLYSMIPLHGLNGYRTGCRCDVCRQASTIDRRKYARNR